MESSRLPESKKRTILNNANLCQGHPLIKPFHEPGPFTLKKFQYSADIRDYGEIEKVERMAMKEDEGDHLYHVPTWVDVGFCFSSHSSVPGAYHSRISLRRGENGYHEILRSVRIEPPNSNMVLGLRFDNRVKCTYRLTCAESQIQNPTSSNVCFVRVVWSFDGTIIEKNIEEADRVLESSEKWTDDQRRFFLRHL